MRFNIYLINIRSATETSRTQEFPLLSVCTFNLNIEIFISSLWLKNLRILSQIKVTEYDCNLIAITKPTCNYSFKIYKVTVQQVFSMLVTSTSALKFPSLICFCGDQCIFLLNEIIKIGNEGI